MPYNYNVYLPDSAEVEQIKTYCNFNTPVLDNVPQNELPCCKTIWDNSLGASPYYICVAVGVDVGQSPIIPSDIQQFETMYIFFDNDSPLYTNYIEQSETAGFFWFALGWYLNPEHTTTTHLKSMRTRCEAGYIPAWRVNYTYDGSSGPIWAMGNAGIAAYIIDSSIPITINNSPYDPREHDEHIFYKHPDTYAMSVGVRCNELSATPTVANIYETKRYNIRIRWTSPVTGTQFDIPLSELPDHTAHYTATAEIPITLRFSYTTVIGAVAKGLRMPIGAYEFPPTVYDELTDVPAIRDISLTDLKTAAQTQQAGVINDDLFTEIFADFYDADNQTKIFSKSVDYSSLFGEDIDIGGSTIPDPNDAASLTDDNVYTDRIDLTTPTLTATGVFNRCYTMDGNGVNDLCDFLYNANDSIFDEIIDGVLTRGNPIESLIDLRLYPFDVRAFTGAGTAESIKFGRTDTGVIGIKLPQNAQAVIELGHCVIPRYYNNFLDYQMRAQLYIPFCGLVDLPIEQILNHEISLKLIVDYITGAGTAVVFVDSIPIIYQQGVIGVSVPMTATNSAEFGKTIAGNLINTATAAATNNPIAALSEGIDAAANAYNGSHITKIGASSPQTSLFQPKNAYVLLSIVTPASGVYEDEYAAAMGYACFMPVTSIGITTGSGYTVFDNVKMQIPQATEAEREELLQILTTGVFM